MNIMSIFQTNWLDFVTWVLIGCMAIGLVIRVVETWVPGDLTDKAIEVLWWPSHLRKAS